MRVQKPTLRRRIVAGLPAGKKRSVRHRLQILSKWKDSMIWCPSQCYRKVEYAGSPFTLYLRWRWDDPWQGHVVSGHSLYENSDMLKLYILTPDPEEQKKQIEEAKSIFEAGTQSMERWSVDLFEAYACYYIDEQVAEAKKKLLQLAEQYLTRNSGQIAER